MFQKCVSEFIGHNGKPEVKVITPPPPSLPEKNPGKL